MKEFVIRRYRSDQPQGAGQSTLVRIDDEGHVLFADHHAEAVLGYNTSELEGLPVHRVLASREDDPFAPANRHRIKSGQDVLVTLRHKEGFFYTASLSLRLTMRDSDKAASATIIHRDNSAMDPSLLRTAEGSAGFGIWELDTRTNEMTWTEGVFRLLELRPGSEITPEQALFYCQTGQARVRALFRRCIRAGTPFSLELSVLTAQQNLRRIALSGMALKTSNGSQRLGGTLVDRTREMYRDQARQQAEQMLAATIQATPDLVAAVDLDLNLTHFNQPFARQFATTFGVTLALGDNLKEILPDHPNERRMIEQLWLRAFQRGSFVVEMPLAQQQNLDVPLYEFHYQRLTNEQGEATGAVQVAREISSQSSYTGSSEYRLRHDPVTGLMNRRELISRITRTLEQKTDRESCDSLLYLDLDEFGRFNDQAGRGTCDRYLRELAATLGVRVRQRDALARLSGDTFALLIENCPEARARKIAEGILALIDGFVFEWQEHRLQTTASGGLLIMGHDTPGNPEQLISQASDLCHTAKISGRNRIHTAHALNQHTDENVTRRRVEQIRQALDDDSLILEYQMLRPVASATWGD
ncbi:MAG TPA: diguanylate cyclase, partial [Marinobacter sp.]|nr:diguanylate cyclase [Marinobacter sp.]